MQLQHSGILWRLCIREMVNNDCKEHRPEGECKGKANGKHMLWMTRGRKQGRRIGRPRGFPIKDSLPQGQTVSKITAEHRHEELNTRDILSIAHQRRAIHNHLY